MKFTPIEREGCAGTRSAIGCSDQEMPYNADGECERPICSATIDKTDAIGRPMRTRPHRKPAFHIHIRPSLLHLLSARTLSSGRVGLSAERIASLSSWLQGRRAESAFRPSSARTVVGRLREWSSTTHYRCLRLGIVIAARRPSPSPPPPATWLGCRKT